MKYLSKSKSFFGKKLILSALVGCTFTVEAAPILYSGTGDISGVVADFQSALGNPNNGNSPGPISTGRRQINWDAGIVPFNMPGNFFNSPPPTRGAEFVTSGTGFNVSNDGLGDDKFSTINPSYVDQFKTFSAPRLFTSAGSNVLDVNFFVPATNTPATVNGFGAIFTDVDLNGTTKLEFFDFGDNLLHSEFVDADPQGLSFLGATFASNKLARVRITSGTHAIGPDDNPLHGVDIVVMDDFLYGEPQAAVPEPSTLLLAGLGALLLRMRTNKTA
ncbi:MAG TPA: PEP-CTERM sorting domain-containing protein [Nitrosomonas sp.]|uniref:PEP-CTERM sorting domain-containing protein n=1 Tax=Nitrosomonas sp. TaxID=42353 RepID=UPI000E89B19B|nr:PEP-CTERM sorting domain-containing protein [Nitrosomonas sp.]GJL74565.1 MAG: hypothetical protein NMNS02_06710 [Nitrosomonas sp.]HBV21346.1 hypothetical protein [Nitrosomonas sp.]HNP26002.1 PEP-CTERM sorting domain-containing protein [Nitrosomonas sp.]